MALDFHCLGQAGTASNLDLNSQRTGYRPCASCDVCTRIYLHHTRISLRRHGRCTLHNCTFILCDFDLDTPVTDMFPKEGICPNPDFTTLHNSLFTAYDACFCPGVAGYRLSVNLWSNHDR